MLVVTGFKNRETKEGKPFCQIVLQGEPEMIRSKVTSRFYLSAKTCYMASSLPSSYLEKLIGHEFPGSIQKVQCEEYDFKIPESGEVIKLSYRYEYQAVEAGTEEQVIFTPSTKNTFIKTGK